MKVIECEQGGHEWFEARIGRVTASEVGDAVRVLKVNRGEKKKGEEGETRANYRAGIVSEILTGLPSDTFVSKYMQWGTETESRARTAYELKNDVMVREVGFVIHPSIDRAGASPDGLIGLNGGLEIKCPKTDTHVKYMRAGKLPPVYEPQVMWNIACAEREWWDFISYDPRMIQKRFQMFSVRVYRDDMRIKELEDGVRRFLVEVDEDVELLKTLYPEPDQLKNQLRASVEDGITDADIAWIQNIHEEQLSS